MLLAISVGLETASAASLERLVMPGPVSSAHAEIEDECGACHSPLADEPQFKLCVACHESVGEDLAQNTGFHGKHPKVADTECQSCHREHEGRDAQTLAFDLQSFDHQFTDFPLLWAHGDIACEQCHVADQKFSAAPNECVGCHKQDDPHDGELGENCDRCHWQRDWRAMSFDHADTGFELHGFHAQLACEDCHNNGVFSNASGECAACHDKDDVHDNAFGTACDQCHNTSNWKAPAFDHAVVGGFKLDGQHAQLSCESCHQSSAGSSSISAPRTCHDCHAQDDVHQGSFGSDCASCHDTASWSQKGFDHSFFPLLGSHANLTCDNCHQNNKQPLGTSCHQCHSDPHEQQLGQRCESCHSEDSWVHPLRFDHGFSRFPLLGGHELLACADCHEGLLFKNAEGECAACHAPQDVHKGVLGDQCQQCHNPAGWQHTRFDHAAVSSFELLGVHQQVACEGCHQRDKFMRATSPQQCIQCHEQDDPHDGQFGNDCGQCHGVQSFQGGRG